MSDSSIMLNEEQERALSILLNSRENVLLHGAAGTGKSLVVKRFLSAMEARDEPVMLTAPTGVAALNIGGQTLHRWIGARASYHTAEAWTKAKGWGYWVAPGICATRTLLIDEVSMLGMRDFETFSEVASLARHSCAPFGGIRIILVGDMGQLCPVKQMFPFYSPLWKSLKLKSIVLRKVERQQDVSYARLLHRLRRGRMEKADWDSVNSRVGVSDALRLFGTNAEVDACNSRGLRELEGESFAFGADDIFVGSAAQKASTLKQLDRMAHRVVELKVGAPVMVTKNGGDLVNGDMGLVEEGTEDSHAVSVSLNRGYCVDVSAVDFDYYVPVPGKCTKDLLGSRYQFPLRVAFAATVHKCQGLTLHSVSFNASRNRQPGTAYVAMSRTRRLEDLTLEEPMSPLSVPIHAGVQEFLNELEG